MSGANQKKNAGSTINIPQLNASTSRRHQKCGKTHANGWFGLSELLEKRARKFLASNREKQNHEGNTLGLFQHSLNNVPLSTHFLGNSSEHLLVDADTLKETCRQINQTRQKKRTEIHTY